jgi:hypothetical protein
MVDKMEGVKLVEAKIVIYATNFKGSFYSNSKLT